MTRGPRREQVRETIVDRVRLGIGPFQAGLRAVVGQHDHGSVRAGSRQDAVDHFDREPLHAADLPCRQSDLLCHPAGRLARNAIRAEDEE